MPVSSDTDNMLAHFARDVRAGLLRDGQKELPSKYLYDTVGSGLFEVIRVLPEYGVARAGDRVLSTYAGEIAALLPTSLIVAELGSGSARETRHLLDALPASASAVYFPIDISSAAVEEAERGLTDVDVQVRGVAADYFVGLEKAVAHRTDDQGLLVLFLGGTIGNFDRVEAERFLRKVRTHMRSNDHLLLSTDLLKPEPVLVRAYDDDAGVTAAFDMNLLARINRELGGDFDFDAWTHEARFNRQARRIEMHLKSLADQTVRVRDADLTVHFRKNETIWTESSHKYDKDEIDQVAQRCGYRVEKQWIDEAWPFAQNLLIAI